LKGTEEEVTVLTGLQLLDNTGRVILTVGRIPDKSYQTATYSLENG
jgi:hypothetical protein